MHIVQKLLLLGESRMGSLITTCTLENAKDISFRGKTKGTFLHDLMEQERREGRREKSQRLQKMCCQGAAPSRSRLERMTLFARELNERRPLNSFCPFSQPKGQKPTEAEPNPSKDVKADALQAPTAFSEQVQRRPPFSGKGRGSCRGRR